MIRPGEQAGFAGAKAKIKAVLDMWPADKALAYVVDDLGWGLKRGMGHIQSESGSTRRGVAIEDSVTYVEGVFNDYLTYGGLDHPGRSVAEVGPGDNAGVALLLQSAGCDTVGLDRFLLHHCRGLAAELQRSAALDVTILVTSLVGDGEMIPHAPFADLPATYRQRAVAHVEAERHRFAGEFADAASEDLAVTGIFWIGVRRCA